MDVNGISGDLFIMTSFLTLRAEREKIRGLFNESVDICFVVEPSRTGATDGFLPQWQPGIGIGITRHPEFQIGYNLDIIWIYMVDHG